MSDPIATTFHYFSKLPRELRQKVWNYHLPGPSRLIKIKSDDFLPETPSCTTWSQEPSIFRAKAICSTPPLLHACSESRRLALNFFQLGLSNQLGGRPVYFNYAADSLYIMGPDALRSFFGMYSLSYSYVEPTRRVDTHKLQYVLYGGNLWCELGATDLLPLFGHLQTLMFRKSLGTLSYKSVSYDEAQTRVIRAGVEGELQGAWTRINGFGGRFPQILYV